MQIKLQEDIQDLSGFLSEFEYIITPNKLAIPKNINNSSKIIELIKPINANFFSEKEIEEYIYQSLQLKNYRHEYAITTIKKQKELLNEFFLYANIEKIYDLPCKSKDVEFLINFLKNKTKLHKNEAIRQNIKEEIEKINTILEYNPKLVLIDITNTEQSDIKNLINLLSKYQNATFLSKYAYSTDKLTQNNAYQYDITIYDNIAQKEYELKNLDHYQIGSKLFHDTNRAENLDYIQKIQAKNKTQTGAQFFKKTKNKFNTFKEELDQKMHISTEKENEKFETLELLEYINNIYNANTNIHKTYKNISISSLNINSTMPRNITQELGMPDVKIKKINFIKHILSHIDDTQNANIHVEYSVFKNNRILFEKLASLTSGKTTQFNMEIKSNNQVAKKSQIEYYSKMPKQISPSSIAQLNKNPFSFYLQKCLNIEFKRRYFQENIFGFGKAIHDTIEEFSNSIHKHNETPELSKFIKIAKINLPKENIDIDTNLLYKIKTFNIGKEIIKLEKQTIEKGYKVSNEENLHIQINDNIRLYGRVDRIERFGEECRIIDFKTGDITQYSYNSEKSGKATQLSIYAINKKCTELKYFRISGEKTEEKIIQNKNDLTISQLSSFVLNQIKNVIDFYEKESFKYKKINFIDCYESDVITDLIVREKRIL